MSKKSLVDRRFASTKLLQAMVTQPVPGADPCVGTR